VDTKEFEEGGGMDSLFIDIMIIWKGKTIQYIDDLSLFALLWE
jgi:hypothetical protein